MGSLEPTDENNDDDDGEEEEEDDEKTPLSETKSEPLLTVRNVLVCHLSLASDGSSRVDLESEKQ